jgi:hypothetical protein
MKIEDMFIKIAARKPIAALLFKDKVLAIKI